MSMMNRQMPGLKNQHRSNKIRLNWIFMLCAVLIFFEKRISLRLSTVSVSLVEFCWSPVTLVCLLPTLLFIYIHTHPHTYNIYVYIYLFCVPDGLLCASSSGVSSVVFTPAFRSLVFSVASLCFSVLIGCQKESPNSTWQNVWVENRRASKYHHARTHAFICTQSQSENFCPAHFFPAFSSLKRIHVYILPES